MVEHTPDGALIQEGRQIQVDFSGDKNMIAISTAVKSWGYDLGKIFDLILGRHDHVCPRWLCFSFDNIFRRLIQPPDVILKPYIKEGDTVLDVGPGLGYFTIPMAAMAGDQGRVIAADIQGKMLLALQKRARRARMEKRIVLHRSLPDSLGVKEKVDFILAFWMMHEVPDKKHLFDQLYFLLNNKGKFLLVEPKLHVDRANFDATVKLALQAGFTAVDSPHIAMSMTALLEKNTG
jgi:ubiquinone/menaquinone biosynthesis C-methylase UbiE